MLYHIIEMENDNKNDEELVRRKHEQEELDRELERQEEIEKERDLERQEELDQEYGDSYKCLWFCGDKEEHVLER
jgi:hypothetical protein